MDIRPYFKNLDTRDRQKQHEAFNIISKETEKEVHWAYNYWDQLETDLSSNNGNRQLRAVKFLSNLAISDPKNRIFETFEKIKTVTESETTTTQREALTYIWRIALAGEKQQEMIVNYLYERYNNQNNEKQFKMLRTDILVSLKKICLVTNDEALSDRLDQTINEETDLKQYKQNLKALDRVEM